MGEACGGFSMSMEEQQLAEEHDARENAPALTQGIQNVNKVVRALYIYKKEASYKELAGPTGLYPAIASQALSSSKDLGLTKSAGKKGWYLLSSQGVEYARYLTESRTEECQAVLGRVVLGNPLWTDIVSFIRMSGGVPRDPIDLVMSTVEAKLGKQWSPKMRKQVSDSIVSALEFARIVKEDSGKIVALIGPMVKGHENLPQPAHGQPAISPPDQLARIPTQTSTAFYEITGDGFYLKIRKDPSAIAEAYDHLQLIMKRNGQQPSPMPAEPFREVRESSN